MSALKRRAWLLLAATITLQLVLIRSSHSLKHINHPVHPVHPSDPHNHHPSSNAHRSSPLHTLLRRGQGEQEPHESLFALPYADWYDNSSRSARPFVILSLIFILTFLFSFIGISASDFFCPNLATIASYLGLNESTAGVTFLAFGNGSPDVFSTFSAMRGGTFSLAIGELIGAATFSESIV
jgi:sodium/potassium/calcium exchanger 6